MSFSHRFFEGFFFMFTSFLDHFFNEIPTLSYPFFETFLGCFFLFVSHFPDFLFFGRTLADTCFTRGFM